jgi:type II secretory pathway pseudopilin PulG
MKTRKLFDLLLLIIVCAVSFPFLGKQLDKTHQSEARKQIKLITNAQESYFQENGFFAKSTEELLNIGLIKKYKTANYNFQLKIIDDSLFIYGKPTRDVLKTYISAVFFVDGYFAKILCETNDIGDIISDSPELSDNKVFCGDNTTKIPFE